MSKPTSAMVFAAGFGTRMKPLTDDRPKPLIEVAGRPLIDHALKIVDQVGATAVVNAHYRADMLERHLADRPTVQVVSEAPDILETGGGLKSALPMLGSAPVYTLNSDAVWAGPPPLKILAEAWDADRMDALLLLVPLTHTVGYSRAGNFAIDRSGRLTRSPDGLVYTGAQILRTDGLADIFQTSFSLNILWDQMLANDRLFGVTYDGHWADVGTPDGISLAEKMLETFAHV